MFQKLLIANRGEIACRIIRTARRMGIRTIAVHSDADANAMHVALADEAHRIGPPAPRHSTSASPPSSKPPANPAPRPSTPATASSPRTPSSPKPAPMPASSSSARRLPPSAPWAASPRPRPSCKRPASPSSPGYHGEAQDLATLQSAADTIGYPVLIKASAGGGGKGMRVVDSRADFPAALEGAQREARSSFGDDRVLVEKYLSRPRHIEIQVFADTHGNTVSLFERDCSIQRRHQKIIEEAPAPGMTTDMRRAMGDAAIAAARAVDYVGAGTVEFIAEDDRFHFMEMNTRLQVEHPVTEAITGLDLVEWQLRVAAGEPLPLTQDQLAIHGHAVEVRLYAEDPARNFLPSVGTLTHLNLPADLRVDSGVRALDTITPDYDPMIAKLIAHGPDRRTALARLAAALARTEIVGVQTNLPLLRAIAAHPGFISEQFDTGFIPRHPELLAGAAATPDLALAAAALTILQARAEAALIPSDPHSPWSAQDSWRPNLPGHQTLTLRHRDLETRIAATPDGDAWRLEWDGIVRTARATRHDAALLLRLDDTAARLSVVAQPGTARIVIVMDGANHTLEEIDPHAPPEAATAGAGRVMAPIPGRVARLRVKPGDTVAKGQVLLVLEAMKMELPLTAAADGTIATISCAEGEMVAEGVELVTMED